MDRAPALCIVGDLGVIGIPSALRCRGPQTLVQTGLEEINGDLLEADFGTTSSESA